MDKQRLIQYLRNVVDLEKQVFLQKQALYQLDNRIKSLGHAGNVKPGYHWSLDFVDIAKRAGGLIGGGFLGGLVLGFIIAIVALLTKLPGTDYSYRWILPIAFIVAGVGLLIVVIWTVIEKIGNDKHNAFLDEKYNAEKHADAQRVSNELAQKKVLQQERSILYGRYQKTQETLRRFYDVGVIYGKYRYDFAAVASFLDYFQSGRCSTLGENRGGDGAYNLYESELRQNIIINKLDQVLSKLDQIRDNQYSLACAIQEGNRISQRLVKATERLAIAGEQTARNSEIAAYNSQQSANELNQIKWLQLYGMTLR